MMEHPIHAALDALIVYGCDNVYELSALIADVPDWEGLSWSELASVVIDRMAGQADHLDEEGQRLAKEYAKRAAAVRAAIEVAR